jgi:SAM-dependent methyltransferase
VNESLERLGRSFARLATRAVVARPALWRLFRGPLRRQFDRLAPVWNDRLGPEALAPLVAAFDHLDRPPKRVLDLGTGTGKAARAAAERFPQAEVVGVDISTAMVDQAMALLPPELAGRVNFEVGDGRALPYEDGSFDLVVLLNAIPFFDELARVTAADGSVLFASTFGADTPIYVPPETIRRHLEPFGFKAFEDVAAGEGTALVARRPGTIRREV